MLEVKNISCQQNYNLLFDKLSFYLKPSDIIRINGLNGTGKTSLLKIIAGIISTDGQITLFDNQVNTNEYKKQILYLGHQDLINKKLTVKENLEFLINLTDEIKADYDEALKIVGLEHYQDEQCYKLSAGQKRRIILAVLFLTKAKLWLLDEPFTALDFEMVQKIETKIKEFCQNGGMCLFTTHQATSLEYNQIQL